jgi:hypothetical protein
MLKKVLAWGAVAFVIYYLATNPNGAAHLVTGILDGLKQAAGALAKFLSGIKL